MLRLEDIDLLRNCRACRCGGSTRAPPSRQYHLESQNSSSRTFASSQRLEGKDYDLHHLQEQAAGDSAERGWDECCTSCTVVPVPELTGATARSEEAVVFLTTLPLLSTATSCTPLGLLLKAAIEQRTSYSVCSKFIKTLKPCIFHPSSGESSAIHTYYLSFLC